MGQTLKENSDETFAVSKEELELRDSFRELLQAFRRSNARAKYIILRDIDRIVSKAIATVVKMEEVERGESSEAAENYTIYVPIERNEMVYNDR